MTTRHTIPFTIAILAMAVAQVGFARDRLQRIHLSSFSIRWGDTVLDAKSHLDIGIEETDASGERRCKVLNPLKPKLSEKKWMPLDFYTAVNVGSEETHAATVGQPDYFFKGDDNNRNGAQDSHKQTRELAKNLQATLNFLHKKSTEDKVQVLVSFKRGKLKFDGLMEARAFEVKDGCDSALYYCTKTTLVDGKPTCAATDWKYQVLDIYATVDETGYAADQTSALFGKVIPESQKNDVQSLVARVVPVNNPKAEPTELSLATKVVAD